MKKYILTGLLFCTMLLIASYADDKRYNIKSGIIQYDTSSKGRTFGVNTNSKGKRTVYFKNWGALELRDETRTEDIMGQKKIARTLIKLANSISYSVDFEKKLIIKMDIEQFNKNTQLNSEKAFQALNAKKIGTGKVLGYHCDIWSVLGSKVWIYKGVPLKIENSMMGIKTIEVATSAQFNLSISSEQFQLPDFPVKSYNQMINEQIQHESQNSPNSNSQDYNIPSQLPSEEEMMNMLKGFSKKLNGN
jgi:hypothetical protein